VTQDLLDLPLSQLEFLAFDTETTGLVPAQDRIVELSGIRFSLDGEGGTFETLVNPARSIPDAAARVHGIRDEDVADAPGADLALADFAEFCEGTILLAHNAEFDVSFLAHEAARHGISMPQLPVLDTVEISRAQRSDLPNHKLETISKALGCEASTYHRALADAQTLMSSFLKLLGDGAGERPFRWLLGLTSGALSFGPDERLWMWLPPQLKALEAGLTRDQVVTILYEPEGKRQETRDIRPRGWMRRPGAAYLMAHSDRDGSDRSYRLDWIQRAQYAQATLF
jgi:DNA polymerase III epsilon subunit family exonuclease